MIKQPAQEQSPIKDNARKVKYYITWLYSKLRDFCSYQRYDILEGLINKHNYKTFAEVGLYEGRTSFHLLKKCKKLESIYGIDIKLREEALHLQFFDKIELIEKSSVEAAKQFEDNSLDIVFLDADHKYKSVKEDIEAWYPKVRKGGILSGHDFRYTEWGVIKAVTEKWSDPIISSDFVWFIYKK